MIDLVIAGLTVGHTVLLKDLLFQAFGNVAHSFGVATDANHVRISGEHITWSHLRIRFSWRVQGLARVCSVWRRGGCRVKILPERNAEGNCEKNQAQGLILSWSSQQKPLSSLNLPNLHGAQMK